MDNILASRGVHSEVNMLLDSHYLFAIFDMAFC